MGIEDLGNCLSFLKTQYDPCPGKYCARSLINSTNCIFSECQKCERGYRSNKDYDLCLECNEHAKLYDYMYLLFMFNVTVILHFYYIDKSFSNLKKKKNNLSTKKIAIIYALPLIECILSLCLSILVFPPFGSILLTSCNINGMEDWYSVFYNPQVDYYNQLNCTHEVVYPFYSLVMVFLLLVIFNMLLIRTVAKKFVFDNNIYNIFLNKSTFAALYFIPILFLVHTIAGGIIYYTYPFATIVGFLISNNFHLTSAFKENFQKSRIINSLKLLVNKRNLFIQLIHVYFYLFAIISLTKLQSVYDLLYLLCVPIPLVFFFISYKHSDPKRLNWHWEQ
ncbi:unnamed protein product [Brachionus calyciflorus]|uniref:JNK1/MAPK8-associated membrane protein n=1 Tax=Brachionus calyciflorus TaxID=104777 RepID=A0A813M2A4_9BILA|nr:unnamed protein product [Brachionus calyciflorus]